MWDEKASMNWDDVAVEVDSKRWQRWLPPCCFVREELEQQRQSPVFDCCLDWSWWTNGLDCYLLNDGQIASMDVHADGAMMLESVMDGNSD